MKNNNENKILNDFVLGRYTFINNRQHFRYFSLFVKLWNKYFNFFNSVFRKTRNTRGFIISQPVYSLKKAINELWSGLIERMGIKESINSPKLPIIIERLIDTPFSSNKCCFTIVYTFIYRCHITTCSKYRDIPFFKMFVIPSTTNRKDIGYLTIFPFSTKLRESQIWNIAHYISLIIGNP